MVKLLQLIGPLAVNTFLIYLGCVKVTKHIDIQCLICVFLYLQKSNSDVILERNRTQLAETRILQLEEEIRNLKSYVFLLSLPLTSVTVVSQARVLICTTARLSELQAQGTAPRLRTEP